MAALRNRTDQQLTVVTALPAAGATVTSAALDLLGDSPTVINTIVPEEMDLRVSIPALPNNTSSSDSITATFVDSADGVAFAPCAELDPIVIPGVASTGSAAVQQDFRPPPNSRRYIAVQYSATSGAGNNTASKGTFQFVF